MANTGFVVAGKVARAHGLRGEIGVISYADSPQLFREVKRIYIKTEFSKPRKHTVLSVREHGGAVLLTLDGVASRQQALGLVQTEIWIRKRDLPRTEGDLLVTDLIGWEVMLPDGSRLGRIREVQTPGGQEVWAIEDEQGREVLFPAAEELILEADETAGRAVVDPPPGLVELYLGKH